jgi:zinc protease
MPTRCFRWLWTCFCIPNSARKSCNWPSSRKPRASSAATTMNREIAERESAKLVYGANSPYTRQPELATIGAVTVDDLKAWHDRTIGGKLIVGISGDFDPVAMEAKLRAAFEGLPPVKPARPPRRLPGPTPGVYFIDKEDVNQSNVEIVGLGIDRHNPDVPALAVMNEILGGGFASRLFQKVRTELGLAYAVGGGMSFAYDHPAVFRVGAHQERLHRGRHQGRAGEIAG